MEFRGLGVGLGVGLRGGAAGAGARPEWQGGEATRGDAGLDEARNDESGGGDAGLDEARDDEIGSGCIGHHQVRNREAGRRDNGPSAVGRREVERCSAGCRRQWTGVAGLSGTSEASGHEHGVAMKLSTLLICLGALLAATALSWSQMSRRRSIKQVYEEVKTGRVRVGLYAMLVTPLSLVLIIAGLYLAFTWR
jgi:hypothetical protein